MMKLERDVERLIVRETEKRSGVCLKVGQQGWPDRLLLLPGGRSVWAELKRPDGELSLLQKARIAQLTALGHMACVIRSQEAAVSLFERLDSEA